jgi:ATP-dependent helicase HrpA
LQETALEHLRRHILPHEALPALTKAHFETAVAQARERFPGLAAQFMDRLGVVLQLCEQVRQRICPVTAPETASSRKLSSLGQLGATAPVRAANPLAGELAGLVSSRFLERIPYERLTHLPRYLKGLLIRAERAALNPAKDQERLRRVAPYLEALKELRGQPAGSAERQREIESFHWMIEEFKISLFAQELGTEMPVSPKRLEQLMENIQNTA